MLDRLQYSESGGGGIDVLAGNIVVAVAVVVAFGYLVYVLIYPEKF